MMMIHCESTIRYNTGVYDDLLRVAQKIKRDFRKRCYYYRLSMATITEKLRTVIMSP